MSGIGSISGSGMDTYALLRQVLNKSNSSDSTESTASTTSSSSDASGTGQSDLLKLIAELVQPESDGQQTEPLADQLKTAITTAVQKAQDSGNTSDLKQVIEDAVDQTLKDNGYDPEKLKEELQSTMGSMPDMPPPPPPPDGSNNTNSSNSDGSDSSSTNNSQIDPWTRKLLSEIWNSDSSASQNLCGVLFDVQQ